MKVKSFNELPLGVYRFYWKSGGSSLASVGCRADGKNWIACTNWITPAFTDESIDLAVEEISMFEEIEINKNRQNDEIKFQMLCDWRNNFTLDEFELFKTQINMLLDSIND